MSKKGGKVKYRRALKSNEINRLLSTSEERMPLYLTALSTGLRRGELMELRWGDIILRGDDSFIKARETITKNKKSASLPLRKEVTEVLKSIRPIDYKEGSYVFKGSLHKSREFHKDLLKANIKLINDLGQIIDFHSLRYTFCTNLAISGVNIRYAMKLMRHSDINLTTKIYTDAGILDVRPSINRLPNLLDSRKDSRKLFAEGHSKNLDVTEENTRNSKKKLEDEAKSHEKSQEDIKCHRQKNGSGSWIRTNDQVVNSHLLYR